MLDCNTCQVVEMELSEKRAETERIGSSGVATQAKKQRLRAACPRDAKQAHALWREPFKKQCANL